MEKGHPSEKERKRLTPEQEERRTVEHTLTYPQNVIPYGDWTIYWTGWRRPINQIVELGTWWATMDGFDGYVAMTTNGEPPQVIPLKSQPFSAHTSHGIYDSDGQRIDAALAAYRALTRALRLLADRA